VAYVCESNHDRRRIVGMGAWRGEDTRGQVVNFLNEFRSRLALVRVDSIGVGHNFALHLRDCRFPVDLINVAIPCESNPQLGEDDPTRRFVNQKACFYQTLADAFERDQIEGLADEATIGQLAGILYEFDSQGRIKIESKERARARGVPSPDRAEALMLALSRPYQKMEVYTIRDLSRLRSRSAGPIPRAHPYWGFTEVPDDENEVPESLSRQLERHMGKLRWPRGGGAW
jgi:hypothetical protein